MRHGALVLLGAISLLVGWVSGAGAEQQVVDGFSANRTLRSRYFSVQIEPGVSREDLRLRLSVPKSISLSVNPAFSPGGDNLEDQLDVLYLVVSEILDIHLKNFNGQVKICEDSASLSRIAMNLFGRPVQNQAFYVVALDTLYVDAQTVTLGVLGHEMSHAIQTHYFVVPPPEKIQEVLAGYVEYELRRYSGASS